MKYHLIALAVGITALTGCTTFTDEKEFAEKVEETNTQIAQLSSTNNYALVDKPRIVFEAVSMKGAQQDEFDTVRVNMTQLEKGATLASIIEMFQKKGLNVIASANTTLNAPLLKYAIKDMSARRALDIITQDMGMGYEILKDGVGKPYAVITGMPVLEYRLSVPNSVRILKQYVVNKTREEQTDTGSAGGSSGSASSSGGEGSAINELSSTVEVKSAFWDDLDGYLASLLNETVQIATVNQELMGIRGPDGAVPLRYVPEVQSVGTVSINRTTGHIAVTAPKHKLSQVKRYLKELDLLMNSQIQIKGKLVAYTSTEREQRGIDVAHLAPYCSSSFRCIVSNDLFNNVTITEPSSAAATFFEAGAENLIGSSMLGVQALDQTWQVFNAYTQDNNNVRIIDTFEGATTHGVEVTFTETVNNINQILGNLPTVTTDGVTSGGGTSNELLPYRTGSIVTVVPTLDVRTGKVKNLIDVKLSLPGNVTNIRQVTSTGVESGEFQNVNTIEFQVQPIQRIGELTIAAGKTSSSIRANDGGTTGLKDSPIGALFGQTQRVTERTTYYILLQAKVIPAGV